MKTTNISDNMKKAQQQDVFKIVIWIVIVVFTFFVGYKIISFIVNFIKEKQMYDIKEKVVSYLESDNNNPFRIDFPQIKYVCFANSISEQELKRLQVPLVLDENFFNEVKNGMELKELVKNGQAPLIIVDNNNIAHKYYIKNLLISPDPVPKCFKNGELIIKYSHLGFISIKKYEKTEFDYR